MSPWLWTLITWGLWIGGIALTGLVLLGIVACIDETWKALRRCYPGMLGDLIRREAERRVTDSPPDPRPYISNVLKTQFRKQLFKEWEPICARAIWFPFMRSRTRTLLRHDLADAYLELGEMRLATKQLARILRRDRNDVATMFKLLTAYCTLQAWDKALAITDRLGPQSASLTEQQQVEVHKRRAKALVQMDRAADAVDEARWLWQHAPDISHEKWEYLWILHLYDAAKPTPSYRHRVFWRPAFIPVNDEGWWLGSFVAESLNGPSCGDDTHFHDAIGYLRQASVEWSCNADMALVVARRAAHVAHLAWLFPFACDYATTLLNEVLAFRDRLRSFGEEMEGSGEHPSDECSIPATLRHKVKRTVDDVQKHAREVKNLKHYRAYPQVRAPLFLNLLKHMDCWSPAVSSSSHHDRLDADLLKRIALQSNDNCIHVRACRLACALTWIASAIATDAEEWEPIALRLCRVAALHLQISDKDSDLLSCAIDSLDLFTKGDMAGIVVRHETAWSTVARHADRDFGKMVRSLGWLHNHLMAYETAIPGEWKERLFKSYEAYRAVSQLDVADSLDDILEAAEARAAGDAERERNACTRLLNKAARTLQLERRLAAMAALATQFVSLGHGDLAERTIIGAKAQLETLGRTTVRARLLHKLANEIPAVFGMIRLSLLEEAAEMAWHSFAGNAGTVEDKRQDAHRLWKGIQRDIEEIAKSATQDGLS